MVQILPEKTESSVDYASGEHIVVNEDSIIPVSPNGRNNVPALTSLWSDGSRPSVLSDQSVVWLNAGSRLLYPQFFQEEAGSHSFGSFFQIEKTSNPFHCETADTGSRCWYSI
jgi:hypothetical protein